MTNLNSFPAVILRALGDFKWVSILACARPQLFRQLVGCFHALAFVLCASQAHAQGCPSNPGGSPKKQCANVGNPINVMSGNKYQREEDMPALPGVLGLELVRHYNSAFSGPSQPNGVLGRGWRLSYETEVVDRWGKVQVLEADGGRVIFDRDPKAPSRCSTPDPGNGTMTIGRGQDGQADYTWTWTNGRKFHFNSAGKLDRIAAPTGEVLRLIYDNQNVLVRVIDPQGRSLNLVYYDQKTPNQFHGVQFIDTPVGRFAYEYGSKMPKGAGMFDQRQLLANLVRVRLPDQFDPDKKAHALTSRGTTVSTTSRIYHHEDPRGPWLMTGISIEAVEADGKAITTRYATYGYDDTGRAILSTHAGNVDKVTLDYTGAGKTVLTNSLGRKTVYRYTVIAGEYRLMEVRGAGCALCGEPNVRYRYDAAGRRIETTKLAENGDPVAGVKTDRDTLGRVVRVSKIVYQPRKPSLAQLQVRFEYRGNGFAPVLVSRPSVVPGKELLTRIDYNDSRQPRTISESGWSPAVDGKQAAVRIKRTIRYRYATVNGRSLLTEIDGPLANGKTNTPVDSDITRIEYDHRTYAFTPTTSPARAERLGRYNSLERDDGILTAIIMPGNLRNEVEYDYAGRVTAVKNAEGHTTTLRYAPRGQLLAITKQHSTYRTLYDAFDHPIETRFDSGSGSRSQALARYGYDNAGRNTWTALALGIVQTRRFDTEGELLEQSNVSNTVNLSRRYEYDHLGRLLTVTGSNGTSHIEWNGVGLPDALTDAMGRTTRFGYDDSRNITTVEDAANATTRFEQDVHGHVSAVINPGGATTRYVRDDFGRIVATISPDSGMTTYRFDAADRLIGRTDANGNKASYEYDVMGRILSQRVTDVSKAGKQTVTTWRYSGTHLVAINHPNQAERYSYDLQNCLSAKTVVLKLASGTQLSYTTRYRYDSARQLAGITLPDGSSLEYKRNGQNQITALERLPASSSWLRRLLPRQTIVTDLERDVVGLDHLKYGNGIEAYYQRSYDGVLARIAYRDVRRQSQSDPRGGLVEEVLGVRHAEAGPAGAPGALDVPPDQKALLDHRYLWDMQGNLLYTRDKGGASGYAYDARDRLIAASTAVVGTEGQTEAGAHARFARYYYDDDGNRLLAQEGLDQGDTTGNTVKISYTREPGPDKDQASDDHRSDELRYDITGQLEHLGSRSFVWNALGELLEVHDGKRLLARYRYNHRGERIEKIVGSEHTYYLYEDRKVVAELDGKGTIRRQYVYLADQPVAVIDADHYSMDHDNPSSALRSLTDINETLRTWLGNAQSIVYLHSNHLGAIEMATDDNGKPIWQATYDPFGKLVRPLPPGSPKSGGRLFELNLRLPGQYADKETGLYYNDHRYYDPVRGRYLSPDPIGLAGGSNLYAYVNNNPQRFIDPEGLVLFAFDGTGNTDDQTWLAANNSSLSNVWQFRQLYADGNRRYVSGVGTVHRDPRYGDIDPAKYAPVGSDTTDMGGNYSGPARIQRMLRYFNDEADLASDNDPMEIDIVGFSRGAAEARDFANWLTSRITDGRYFYYDDTGHQKCQTVDFRFMGLFDTVLSQNNSSSLYDLRISDQFAYVAQAVALNEHRGDTVRRLLGSLGAFPLESIMGGSIPKGKTRIERGFLGSHGDIGGGFGPNERQLSQVALAWMVDQAKAAGIKMGDSPLLHTIISNPVIHDKSDNQFSTTGAPVAPGLEDRTVRYQNGKTTKQMAMAATGMTWADTQRYITYLPAITLDKGQTVRFPRGDFVTGTVDMRGYLAWLNRNGYKIGLEVQ